MHILIFTAFYLPGYKGGGPIRTISNMVSNLGDEFDFSIYTSDRDLGDITHYPSITPNIWQKQKKTNVFFASPKYRTAYDLWEIISNFKGEVIYLNSFFSFRFSILPLILQKIKNNKKVVIIAPRGEFSNGALRIKSFKKRFYINLINLLGLYKGIVWHASTEHEASDIRRSIGNDAKIKLALNISLTGDNKISYPIKGTPLRVVFASRISPMKNLLGAIDILKRTESDILFHVYGPSENEIYWKTCLLETKKLPNNVKFEYMGHLKPNDVINKLAEYDLFILPTFGENFGHIISEALSAGLPLLISDTTPWRNLLKKGIGWDVPLENPGKFAEHIEECCKKNSMEYLTWRKSIRAWAIENIGQNKTIEQNKNLFINF